MSLEGYNDNLMVALETLWSKFLAYIPSLVSAIIIIVAGVVISKLLQHLTMAGLALIRFDKVSEKVGIHDGLRRFGIKKSASEILGLIIFWVLLLVFFISAAETLDVQYLTQIIDAVIFYLPNVLGAGLIFVFGLIFAHFLRNVILGASERMGEDYAHLIANIIHAVVIVLVTVLAIGQLKIEVELLFRIIEIAVLASGVAIALAVGLGCKDLAYSIVAGFYAREIFKEGMYIELADGTAGTVEKIGAISTKMATMEGNMLVPNSQLTGMKVKQVIAR